MNSDYISYEALLAARQSAYWAKLAMLGDAANLLI